MVTMILKKATRDMIFILIAFQGEGGERRSHLASRVRFVDQALDLSPIPLQVFSPHNMSSSGSAAKSSFRHALCNHLAISRSDCADSDFTWSDVLLFPCAQGPGAPQRAKRHQMRRHSTARPATRRQGTMAASCTAMAMLQRRRLAARLLQDPVAHCFCTLNSRLTRKILGKRC
jgi:hypothetical protein